ncbi:uncharacterized protein LOC125025606 [Penaeus chinensis]|uniref:uncharacterized protein LOC125025606 n=1 Tax=Penaeus chinensis TaxID=139456 RepID=UPI001FB7EE7C|nr:uncharacterized protein LOC125025606 [Penaeus chinensis]
MARYISGSPGCGPAELTPSPLSTPTAATPAGVGAPCRSVTASIPWFLASNATISVEVVQADSPSVGVQPWAVWRQSGHKGRHWLSTTVLVPPMQDIERYKIAFLVSHDSHAHQSQQLHLASLEFKVVLPEALSDVGLSLSFEPSF